MKIERKEAADKGLFYDSVSRLRIRRSRFWISKSSSGLLKGAISRGELGIRFRLFSEKKQRIFGSLAGLDQTLSV